MGYFAIRARPTAQGVVALQSMTASGLRDRLSAMAEQLGGSLFALYFNAGDLSMLAIFDLPSQGSSGPIIQLLASGGFEPGATMARVERAHEVDAALAAAFNAGAADR